MKKFHIMHILLSLEAGGMEGGVVNLVNKIDDNLFKFSICCLEKSGVLEEKILPERRKLFVMGKKSGVAYSLPLRLAWLFRKERVDIVHTHNFTTYLYGGIGAILGRVPYIIQGEHGDLPLQKDRASIMRWRRCLSHFTTLFHTVSARLKEELIEWVGVKPEKIFSILNGVDLAKFRIINPSLIRKRLGLKEEDFVIGAVGRLNYLKNYPLLISALPQMKERVEGLKVIFIGEGPEKDSLSVLARRLKVIDIIKFLGFRTDIPELLNATDLLIQPSLSEGMSNTILESMACGKPVVASDVGGNKEVVVDGVTGYLFPSERRDILEEKLISLAGDEEKRYQMGIAGRKRVEGRFSLNRMVKGYEDFYKHIYYSARD